VVELTETDRGVARVGIRRPVHSGELIRRAGEDLASGVPALGAGAALGPQQVALLAAIGRDRVVVRPRPRVLVISTGSELIDVGHKPAFGEVTDSNSYLITAAAKDAGADSRRIGIVPDDHSKLLDVLESQLLRADILVTTGGVSMGAFDIVRQALTELGSVEFTHIAMHPGQPQGFGHLGDKVPIFCLPGDPVSAMVSFEAFVRPAIRKLLGKRNLQRATVQAVALERFDSPSGVREYRRGVLHRESTGGYSVSLVGGDGSHLIAALAAANCLIVVDEEVTEVVSGSRVTVIPLLLSNR
jgi:molybdopterin molybdotransferase